MVKNIASAFMWKLIYFEKLWLTSESGENEGLKKILELQNKHGK